MMNSILNLNYFEISDRNYVPQLGTLSNMQKFHSILIQVIGSISQANEYLYPRNYNIYYQ